MTNGNMTALGVTLNFMAQHNDVEGVKYIMNRTRFTLDEIYQKCPFLDIGYMHKLRITGDI